MTFGRMISFGAGFGLGYYVGRNPGVGVVGTGVRVVAGGSAIVAITVVGAIVGAYHGALKGGKWGEKEADKTKHLGTGAFEIPIGFIGGGIIGLLGGGTTAFALSSIISTIAIAMF